MIFKVFCQKIGERIGVFDSNKAKFCKKLTTTLDFEKNANFFAENYGKPQKTVIITSTPGCRDELVKNSTKCGATLIMSKILHLFFGGKSGPEIWATFVIFKRLPKENNHPIGENSPNLVTLPVTFMYLLLQPN
jgi:hypothetical protein